MSPPLPSQVLAARLVEIRKRRGWSQQRLAERLDEIGAPMAQPTLARTERGKRDVSLDEALALAAALGVAPTSLFLPYPSSQKVTITPKRVVSAMHARRWARGRAPLEEEDAREYRTEVGEEELRAMEDASLRFLLGRVQELVDATVSEDREAMADAVDALGDELERMRAAQLRREGRRGTN